MTSQDFRFKQRAWFLTKSESICQGCSKGCNIYIDHNKEKYQDDIIYRFRPRLNQQVNGYFMCDAGRMTYKAENDNRMLSAQIAGKEASGNEAVENIRRALSQASKVVMLVSPNCSLEQLQAVKKIADANNAVVSGYSDGYIIAGNGDEFLIQDDKSANRAAFTLLGIESSKTDFDAALVGADLLISFQNDLHRSLSDSEISKIQETTKIVYIGSYKDGLVENAAIVLPVAAFSEDTGIVINVDNILQQYRAAVMKNEPALNLLHVISLLGGEFKNREEVLTDLSATIAALNNIDLKHIPSEGIALTDKEVSNVAA